MTTRENSETEIRSLPARLTDWALLLLALLTFIALIVPFAPEMPIDTLDSSWKIASSAAVAQGLAFGSDFVFTSGPFASIYTKSFHPATDSVTIAGAIYLAFAYWTAFFTLSRGVKWTWVLLFCLFFAGLMLARDVPLLSLPLLLALQTYKLNLDSNGMTASVRLHAFIVGVTFAALGLLPLIKGSAILLSVGVAALCGAYYFVHRRMLLGFICLAAPVVSLVFFWCASGQALGDLPRYFSSMGPITSGYTEAMAVNGDAWEVVLFVIASAALALVIAMQSQIAIVSRLFLCASYLLYLFICFKAGFVRHDGHAIISGTALLLATLIFPFVIRSRAIVILLILTFLCWLRVDQRYVHSTPTSVRNNVVSSYSFALDAVRARAAGRDWPRRDYDAAMESLRKKAAFPNFEGTTDIYSYQQSLLLASGNTWSPRPVFQSYSAYTESLALTNRDHLTGDKAPDNIIFRIQAIDSRLAALDDGPSWPVLMASYQPTGMENDFLFLKKRKTAGAVPAPVEFAKQSARFGNRVELPASADPIFAKLEIRKSMAGHLANLLFKPSELTISVEFQNGTKREYRLIAEMAGAGFLISPLIENTGEFGMLYSEPGFLKSKLVKSFEVTPRNGPTKLWDDEYVITFSRVKKGAAIDVSGLYKFDGFEDLSGLSVTAAERCDGSIDLVNGILAYPQSISASTLLEIHGWLAESSESGKLSEASYVVLTDANGKHSFLKTRVSPRPDVGAHFKQPTLADAGYITSADVSTLTGQYTLGLAMKRGNQLAICPQFRVPTSIGR